MQNDKTHLHLRKLCFLSYLTLCLFVIIPIVLLIVGEKVEAAHGLPLIYIALIGISAYDVTSRLYKRVIALEKLVANQKSEIDE